MNSITDIICKLKTQLYSKYDASIILFLQNRICFL